MNSYLVIVVTYMVINVITDFRTLTTNNKLHLLTWIIGLTISYQKGIFVSALIASFVTLVLSLIRENTNILRISAGDSKMLSVVVVFLMILYPNENSLILSLILHLFFYCSSLILMFLGMNFLLITKKEKLEIGKSSISFKGDKRKTLLYSEPASFSILIAIVLFIILN